VQISFAQTIKGIVTGINNVALYGATVSVENAHSVVLTDTAGYFNVNAKYGDILIISFVGYANKAVKVQYETALQISLTPSLSSLDDIVVTGYTSQNVKEITGSVAVVKPKDLVAVPAGQVEQMLQGRVAGLNVVSSGQPGGGSNVRIHGIGNFGDVTPLYIIDGVQGDINNLNPYDIESLQVLKDASAYAIYGVRGANGVIVVTTKKGKTAKATVDYSFYLGYQVPLENGLQYLSPMEEAQLIWLRDKNSGFVGSNGNPSNRYYGNGPEPVLPDYIIHDSGYLANAPQADPSLYNIDYTKGPIYQIVRANKEGTDWFHELYKPALNQNHTITVSAGNEGSHYLFSLGYTNQQGTLLETYLKRYTARVNTEFSVKKIIRIGENMQLTYRDNHGAANQFPYAPLFLLANTYPNNFGNAQSYGGSSLLPVYDIKGNWATFGSPQSHYNSFDDNPMGQRVLTKNNIDHNWEIFGNIYAEADIFKHLTARTSFGGSVNNYYARYYHVGQFQPPYPELGPNNSSNERRAFQTSWTWTNTLNYSASFANKHTIKILAGTEAIDNYSREVDASRSGFFSDNPDYTILSNGTYGISNNGFATQSALFSLLSRLDYSYNDKYFLTGTLRRDGSSVFGPDKRYGWFPSLGLAWQMGNEEFMKKYAWIDELKLRVSYGITGYDKNVDPANQYTFFAPRAGRSFYDIQGTNTRPDVGFYLSRIGNAETGWQQDIVTNFGADAIFWNGKLSITADYYKKESSGLLFLGNPPPVVYTGDVLPPYANIGNVLNKGFDLLLESRGSLSRDVGWDVTFTFDTYRNKIIHLNAVNYFDDGHAVRNEVGYPIGLYYGYKITGIFQSAADVTKSPMQNGKAPGKFKYFDANGDGVINADDKVYIGNPNPKFTSGVNLGFTFKGFDLSAFFYGSFGNDLWNWVNPHGGSRATLYESWTYLRSNTNIPIATSNSDLDFSEFADFNTFFVEKGTYIRNKTLTLGYTLPKKSIAGIGLSYLRIYVEALNLFTITKYSGLDPEITGDNATGNENREINGSYLSSSTPPASGNFGIDYGAYPNGQKQYLIGINLSF
jgi:TonB-linked SusC/RagA family outer membrane protein